MGWMAIDLRYTYNDNFVAVLRLDPCVVWKILSLDKHQRVLTAYELHNLRIPRGHSEAFNDVTPVSVVRNEFVRRDAIEFSKLRNPWLGLPVWPSLSMKTRI